jgi:hypothetical protein
MIPILLSLALTTTQPIHVDRIELNHYHDAQCQPVFSQLIFYTWSSQRKRFDVNEWRLCKSESMVPVKQRGKYFMRWHDDGIMREVVTGSFRETWTQYDPETLERDMLPQDQRVAVLVTKQTTGE